ncbi:MAG: SusC/RagA family TonB-linked outer membrane protein [Gemmatimonadetes bacterium]|nr:SusC/RagA family TonB-linked outer membrane protein [Gemmatimonadota bacterium]
MTLRQSIRSARCWRAAVLVAVAAVLARPTFAQQAGSIAGTVMIEGTATPAVGVRVTVAGLNRSAVTNSEGRYVILNVPPGTHTVRVVRIGFRPQEVSIAVLPGASATADIALAQQAVQLAEMVVTALGITREERALGYAVQGLQGEKIAQAVETNLVNALSGQVAGLQVTNLGTTGASSRIVLRGAKSIAGENQPLFVVDGVPIDNASSSYIRGGRRSGGSDPSDPTPAQTDYGNAARDLNPEDIESVTVLKGANAAALYGSRAANGVVVITTKKGRSGGGRGLSMTATTSTTLSTPLIMPTYQNEYGQGGAGLFRFLDGRGGGQNDGTDESWGPRMDGRMIPSWYSSGTPVPFMPFPYNVRQFFGTGRAVDHHVTVAGATEDAEARVSFNRLDESGMVPTHQNDRTGVTLNGGVGLSKLLKVTGGGTYTKTTGQSIPGRGYTGFNPLQGYIWFGRQVDTWLLQNYLLPDGSQFNWNYNYHDNPYWEVHERDNTQDRDRLTGNLQVQLKVADWLSLSGRTGTDWYSEERKENIPKASPQDLRARLGGFDHSDIFRQETNTDFLATVEPKGLLGGNLSVSLRGGGNVRYNLEKLSNTSVGSLVVPGIYSVTNAATPPVIRTYEGRKKVNSLYGLATLGWRDYLFLDVTGRNDWSSTLPVESNSYFYPSVSTSLVFTDLLQSRALSSVLSLGKLRASWARVGNDARPYQLAAVLEQRNPFGNFPVFSVNQEIPNSQLRPETTESWEFGTELRSANERVGLDLTYYRSATSNQILGVQVSAASGYTRQILNAGRVTNRGIEAVLNVTPVRLSNGFSWDVTSNFSRNRSLVQELYGNLQSIVLGEFWGINVEARAGEPYGALYGFKYRRDPQGRWLIDDRGFPIRESNKSTLGYYEPDFLAGLRNTFTHRDFELSFLIDWKKGGELFSVTNMWGRYSGVLVESLEGRETGIVIPGVRQSDGQPNTTVVPAEVWQHTQWSTQENNIFDASYVKLREVRVGFDLPRNIVRRLPVQSARISLVGRNLLLIHKNSPHIDPETGFDASNFQGVEYAQLPPARTLGFTLRVVP